MTDEARDLARALVVTGLLTIASYALLRAMPSWEIWANGSRSRWADWRERQHEFRRARSEVLFEAFVATREAAE